MLRKIEKFNRRLSTWFEWIGIAGIMLMMVVTCVDVVGAKAFKLPLFGALDVVMLFQIVAISFAASITLVSGRHIRVDFFFNIFPRCPRIVINSIVLFLGLGLFVLIVWRLGVLGYSFHSSGEYSATAYIPLYPFAYAAAFASIPVCLVLLVEFLRSLTKRRRI